MAKKIKNNSKKLNFKDIIKGKFLIEENAFSNWKFIVFIIFLAFVMISSTHWVDNKVKKINKLKDQVEESKAEYAVTHSKLMKLNVESELAPVIVSDSLFSLEEHPIKIMIPKDE